MANGRVAFVTGGASGIGEATARRLAADGDRVVISDVNEASGEAIVEELRGSGTDAHFIKLDVSDEAAVFASAEKVSADVGPVDVLVNSAGLLENATLITEMDRESHDQIWNVNYWGTMHCCRAFGAPMVANGRGAIVNIASITSFNAFPLPAYSPSKAAVKSLTELLSVEYGRAGVRVNAVAPTYTLTPAIKSRIQSGHRDPDSIKGAGALHVFVEPRHIAEGIHFLCSDASEVITGVTLPIDAGWLAARGYNHYVGGKPWEA